MDPRPLPRGADHALAEGEAYEAIRIVQKSAGVGLLEARDWVDAHREDGPTSLLLMPEVINTFKKGDLDEAMTLVRAETTLDAAEAREVLEALRNGKGLAAFKAMKRLADTSRGNSLPGGGGSPAADPSLAPGEVPRGGGAVKWMVLIVVAMVILFAVLAR